MSGKARVGLVLIVIGGVVGWLGIQELRLSNVASATAQEMTLKDLIAKGPGENAHLTIKEFVPCNNYLYKGNKGDTSWNGVWIPIIVPKGAGDKLDLQPKSFQVILKCPNVKNENELGTVVRSATLKGIVINEIESLDSKHKDLLKQTYPNTDFDKCWIFEVGREPASPGKYLAFLGGGLVSIVAGALLLILGRNKAPKPVAE